MTEEFIKNQLVLPVPRVPPRRRAVPAWKLQVVLALHELLLGPALRSRPVGQVDPEDLKFGIS